MSPYSDEAIVTLVNCKDFICSYFAIVNFHESLLLPSKDLRQWQWDRYMLLRRQKEGIFGKESGAERWADKRRQRSAQNRGKEMIQLRIAIYLLQFLLQSSFQNWMTSQQLLSPHVAWFCIWKKVVCPWALNKAYCTWFCKAQRPWTTWSYSN